MDDLCLYWYITIIYHMLKFIFIKNSKYLNLQHIPWLQHVFNYRIVICVDAHLQHVSWPEMEIFEFWPWLIGTETWWIACHHNPCISLFLTSGRSLVSYLYKSSRGEVSVPSPCTVVSCQRRLVVRALMPNRSNSRGWSAASILPVQDICISSI